MREYLTGGMKPKKKNYWSRKVKFICTVIHSATKSLISNQKALEDDVRENLSN